METIKEITRARTRIRSALGSTKETPLVLTQKALGTLGTLGAVASATMDDILQDNSAMRRGETTSRLGTNKDGKCAVM